MRKKALLIKTEMQLTADIYRGLNKFQVLPPVCPRRAVFHPAERSVFIIVHCVVVESLSRV